MDKHVIYSVDRRMFWSNIHGWGSLENATRYSESEANSALVVSFPLDCVTMPEQAMSDKDDLVMN